MVWLIVATLAASFIKGVCGFANTLVFTTILSFSFNNIQITPMVSDYWLPSQRDHCLERAQAN